MVLAGFGWFWPVLCFSNYVHRPVATFTRAWDITFFSSPLAGVALLPFSFPFYSFPSVLPLVPFTVCNCTAFLSLFLPLANSSTRAARSDIQI